MGLSSMNDFNKHSKAKFALCYYNDPTFDSWEKWFAWYPVKVVYFYTIDSEHGEIYIKTYQWQWLKNIIRRRVVDRLDGPGRENAGKKTYYEYTTTMVLLTYGH